jgi:hypothetical protein
MSWEFGILRLLGVRKQVAGVLTSQYLKWQENAKMHTTNATTNSDTLRMQSTVARLYGQNMSHCGNW